MINNFFYILIICAFNTLAKDEDKEPLVKEIASYTKDYYENEREKDLENLSSSFSNISENDEDYSEPPYTDELRSLELEERIDQAVNEPEIKINDVKDKNRPRIFFVRNEVIESLNSKEKYDEFMKYLKMGKVSTTSHNRLGNQQTLKEIHVASNEFPSQAKRRGFRSRRSTVTQAGYTQDPDTCKTYNENLVKLWSNLSKYINVTEQPNKNALHNIAIMIQAYLEHQNGRQLPESYKTKHTGPRDKITAAMFKIKRLIDKDEGSAEKLTKIIMRYLKPNYVDVQTEDCQKVNEETLASSVDLLYKSYLENILNCNSEDMAKARKDVKTEERLFNDEHLTEDDLNPEIHNILIADELYKDLQKGKIPRQRSKIRNRRFLRPTRKIKHIFRPAIFRTKIENESIKPKVPQVFASKKTNMTSLKSNFADNCEKYSVRKLIVSLRPAMERYMGLFECQHDNTLRSEKFSQVLGNPYYLDATKLYSKADRGSQRKILSKLFPKYLGRKRNASGKKIHMKGKDPSVEIVQDGLEHSGEADYAWVKIYRLGNTKGNNAASPAVTRNTDAQESEMGNKKHQHSIHGYITTYNEHSQSLPLYDDYGSISKSDKLTYGFPSLRNQNNKYTEHKSTRNKLASTNKRNDNKNYYDYDYTYSDESSSEEDEYTTDQQNESLNANGSFTDFTLRLDDQLIEKEKKVQNSESIAEFLKKARDTSLRTPEFAVPFALDTNKGKFLGGWLLLRKSSKT